MNKRFEKLLRQIELDDDVDNSTIKDKFKNNFVLPQKKGIIIPHYPVAREELEEKGRLTLVFDDLASRSSLQHVEWAILHSAYLLLGLNDKLIDKTNKLHNTNKAAEDYIYLDIENSKDFIGLTFIDLVVDKSLIRSKRYKSDNLHFEEMILNAAISSYNFGILPNIIYDIIVS